MEMGFFKETVVNVLGFTDSGSVYETVYATTVLSLVMATLALPGYWCSLPLIEWIGRVPLQVIGFGCEAVIFL